MLLDLVERLLGLTDLIRVKVDPLKLLQDVLVVLLA